MLQARLGGALQILDKVIHDADTKQKIAHELATTGEKNLLAKT